MATDKRKNMWLTTPDNPYNPFTQFDDWYEWDMKMGYDTCGRIARFAPTSDENLTDYENEELINEAINLILDFYDDEVYQLVFEEMVEQPQNS